MASSKNTVERIRPNSKLKRGDTVIVISGGHKTKRPNKGKIGKILGFTGKKKDRVIVEGVNVVKRHQKQTLPGKAYGIIQKEAAIHVSNVMFYSDKVKKAVRLKSSVLADGKKVRGFINPETKQFEQVD